MATTTAKDSLQQEVRFSLLLGFVLSESLGARVPCGRAWTHRAVCTWEICSVLSGSLPLEWRDCAGSALLRALATSQPFQVQWLGVLGEERWWTTESPTMAMAGGLCRSAVGTAGPSSADAWFQNVFL